VDDVRQGAHAVAFLCRMVKKSLFSPALPQRAETRSFPCIVLASLRGSTYRSVRLASSLAAVLLDSLFEHPTNVCSACPMRVSPVVLLSKLVSP
jgi:hypothetical protein